MCNQKISRSNRERICNKKEKSINFVNATTFYRLALKKINIRKDREASEFIISLWRSQFFWKVAKTHSVMEIYIANFSFKILDQTQNQTWEKSRTGYQHLKYLETDLKNMKMDTSQGISHQYEEFYSRQNQSLFS